MSFPVSTRTLTTKEQGLAAGVLALESLAPSAMVIEAPAGQSLEAVVAALKKAGRPVLAVLGTPFVSEATRGGVEDPDEHVARQGAHLLLETFEHAATLRCPRVVLGLGRGGLPAPGDTPVVRWREQHRERREEAAGRVCRRLHGILSRVSPAEVHLLLSADPWSVLDPESVRWVLEDLDHPGLRIALDTGCLARREALGDRPALEVCAELAPWVGLCLLADGSADRWDLLPGLGTVDFPNVRRALGRQVPTSLRPDPRVPEAWLTDALGLVSGIWST